ncbi:hypothetical protein SAMN04487950_4099 [Halogranum rubrum]|uniref:CARDB protein n=1 Tax=Halogranum rubrum TaxID=553466 RepID=A0A1I4IBF0_9EURY|nr:FxLYD domain-containing protein [Halogranum rubrum]SFL51669.1 hypothetical protein SAMN04487950_4099 [Halogranum rubrum]
MHTDRFDFELVAVEEASTFSRDVTATVTNTSDDTANDVSLSLDIAAGGNHVQTVDVDVGDLEPGETREITYTLSVSPTQGVALMAQGADLDLTITADGETEQTEGTLDV